MHRLMTLTLTAAMTLIASCGGTAPPAATTSAPASACSPPTTVTPFPIPGAIGVKWNAANGLLAFGRMAENDRFDIWLSDRDGGSARRLTNPAWNDARHQFPIAWHPSGKYLLVLIEKTDPGGNGWDATPGYGAYSDYWLVRPDGSGAVLLVGMPGGKDAALTHAAFSPDGSKFVWTERTKAPELLNPALLAGTYQFNVADFVDGAQPQLTQVKHIVPDGKPQGGEVESMAADNRTIFFHSTKDSGNLFATRLYSLDTDSGVSRQLTTEGLAQVPTLSADGKHIIYMTSADADVRPATVEGADWWIMDLDGSRKQRLTTLSVHGSTQSNGGRQLAGSLAVIDENTFYGDVLTSVFGLVGFIVKVEFKPGCVE